MDYGSPVKKYDEVELHPATDAWMQGDRFGIVQSVSGDTVKVKLNKSRRVITFNLADVKKG